MDKPAVKRFLWQHTRLPLRLLGERTAAQIRASLPPGHGDELLVSRTAEEIMLVVAGGVGIKSTYMPTWGGGTRAQSARV